MAAMSDWLEQNALDHMLNSDALGADISPTSVFVSLHTADPTDADGGEVTTGDYARVSMTGGWTIATTAGVTTAKNTGAITFPQEDTTPYGPVTHFGIHDASSAGNLMYHGVVSPQTNSVTVGDTASFVADSLIFEAKDAFSDYIELNLLKHSLNNSTASAISPDSVYVALFTSSPADDATGTEVSGGSYARKIRTAGWTLDGTGGVWTAKNTLEIDFGTATANWGTVTHFAIFDALTSGSLFYHGPLNNSKIVNNGDSLKFAASQLTIEHQ